MCREVPRASSSDDTPAGWRADSAMGAGAHVPQGMECSASSSSRQARRQPHACSGTEILFFLQISGLDLLGSAPS